MPAPATDPFHLAFLKKCKGYNEKFIDGKTRVSLNVLSSAHKKALPKVEGNTKGILHYTNLSVWYNRMRKLPFVAAYNIDGSSKADIPRANSFKPDPRIDPKLQLGKLYDLVTDFTEFEIGHMASHSEMSWGADSKVRAFQTFHYTNSVPQVERLNSGLWGKLESYVVDEVAEAKNKKICVFTGPMLKDDNPTYTYDKTFKVPLFFFKIIVFSHNKKLHATAFVMSQYKRALELELISKKTKPVSRAMVREKSEPFSDYQHREVFQVSIDLIEDYTGLNFKWKAVNRIAIKSDEHKLQEIARLGGGDALKKRRAFKGPGESSGSAGSGKLNMIMPE